MVGVHHARQSRGRSHEHGDLFAVDHQRLGRRAHVALGERRAFTQLAALGEIAIGKAHVTARLEHQQLEAIRSAAPIDG